MDKPFSIDRIDVNIAADIDRPEREEPQESRRAAPDPGTPFRILLLGDFTGRTNRRVPAADARRGTRPPLEVDRDDLDRVIDRLKPELDLEVGGGGAPVRLTIHVSSIDDFHPDRLFERLDVFRTLRSLRERLHDPAAYRAAAAEVREWVGTTASAERRSPAPAAPEPAANEGEQVVRELLAGKTRAGRAAPAQDDWARFLRDIVAPHVVERDDPERPDLVAAVDRAASALMRAVLHHPDFQALEAAWRGVEFLARRLETGTDLQLYLLDASKEDLAAAVEPRDDPRSTWLYSTLVERAAGTPGAVPWAVLAGNYTFEASAADISILSAMGRVARAAGAPFVAGGSARLLGCESLDRTPDPDDWQRRDPEESDRWSKLRASSEAAYLGLALPRFLLRLPYGGEGERCETFDFEELTDGAHHEHYLWASPAFACACLLGQAFSEHGWGLRPGAVQEIDDLPLHVYEQDGERRVKPCAEVLLTIRAAETILETGLMPLLSFRDRDVVRLARFQSLREPPGRLPGRWP